MRTMKLRMLVAAMSIACAPLALQAATAATTTTTEIDKQTTQLNVTAENKGQTQVATKIASSFTKLAGSQENALKLVQALRNGTSVALATPTSSTGTGTGGTGTGTGTATGGTPGTSFTPPTGKMGWGNVFISLALAQDALARAGITSPTNAQLQAALMGGDVTGADGKTVTLKGILQMRADGMGWGQIAQASGTKLGPVVSSIKSAHTKVAALPATPGSGTTTTATTTGSTKSSKGVSTAEGTSGVSSGKASKGITTAAGASGGTVTAAGGSGHGNSANAPGRGVVNAAGGGAGNVTAATGSGHGQGAGVVNAGGGNAAGVSNAGGQGQGKGNAGGNGKGKGGG